MHEPARRNRLRTGLSNGHGHPLARLNHKLSAVDLERRRRDAIAARVAATRAAARCSSAASSAIGCSAAPRRTSISRSSAFRRSAARRSRSRSGRVEPVGQAFPVYKLGAHRRRAAPARIENRPRTQGLHGRGRSVDAVRGGRAAARLHDQRDRLGSADRRVSRSVRRPGGSRPPRPSRRRSGNLCGRLAARAPRAAVCRALRADDRSGHRGASARRIALDDLPAERIWGEFEKLLLQAERPSIGFALARELGVIHQLLPEMEPLFDCPQDPEWHPEGDVWMHTLMVIDQARELNGDLDRPRLADRSCSARSATISASRRRPR